MSFAFCLNYILLDRNCVTFRNWSGYFSSPCYISVNVHLFIIPTYLIWSFTVEITKMHLTDWGSCFIFRNFFCIWDFTFITKYTNSFYGLIFGSPKGMGLVPQFTIIRWMQFLAFHASRATNRGKIIFYVACWFVFRKSIGPKPYFV